MIQLTRIVCLSCACALLAPQIAMAADRFLEARYEAPEERLDPKEAVRKINTLRREQGLPAVSIDSALMDAAAVHARDLAAQDDAGHYGTDGSTPLDRVFKAGYSGVLTGENVSAGQRDLNEVLEGWLNSKSHRRTLFMPQARHMGVALAYDPQTKYRTFWTLILAEPF